VVVEGRSAVPSLSTYKFSLLPRVKKNEFGANDKGETTLQRSGLSPPQARERGGGEREEHIEKGDRKDGRDVGWSQDLLEIGREQEMSALMIKEPHPPSG